MTMTLFNVHNILMLYGEESTEGPKLFLFSV